MSEEILSSSKDETSLPRSPNRLLRYFFGTNNSAANALLACCSLVRANVASRAAFLVGDHAKNADLAAENFLWGGLDPTRDTRISSSWRATAPEITVLLSFSEPTSTLGSSFSRS